jgi:predicted CoA-binding protein
VTVKELRDKLKDIPDDIEVVVVMVDAEKASVHMAELTNYEDEGPRFKIWFD